MRYLLIILLVILVNASEVFAGWCYMTRIAMQWSATTKQAVYMRSMPCMEEWGTIVTARGWEVLTILQESDGRYQLQRVDGTVWWIYYTWLVDINATNVVLPEPVIKDPYVKLSLKTKRSLNNLAEMIVERQKTDIEWYERIMNRIDTVIQKMPKYKLMFTYLRERIYTIQQ